MAAVTPMAGRNFPTNSRRSMPLYHSPKVRKSIGSAVHLTPVGQSERNLEKVVNSGGAEFDFQVSTTIHQVQFLIYSSTP